MLWRCHQCEMEWEDEKRAPGAKELCPSCAAYLHCCLNCRHHDRHAHNQCRIPNTDWVTDRKGPNFCDEFEFRARAAPGPANAARDAKDAFGQLFGDSPSDDSGLGFDDLFKSDNS